jgi:hypothetical protein
MFRLFRDFLICSCTKTTSAYEMDSSTENPLPPQEVPQEVKVDPPAEAPPQEVKVDAPVEAPPQEVKVDAPAEVPPQEIKVDAPAEVPPQEVKVDAPAEIPPQEVKVDAPVEVPPQEVPQQEVKVDTPPQEVKVDAPPQEIPQEVKGNAIIISPPQEVPSAKLESIHYRAMSKQISDQSELAQSELMAILSKSIPDPLETFEIGDNVRIRYDGGETHIVFKIVSCRCNAYKLSFSNGKMLPGLYTSNNLIYHV